MDLPPLRTIIGRERETSEVVRLVGATRLVTLTGPGGVGKTTLARHAAGMLAPRYPAGAVFVDLSPLRDPALLLSLTAQALGITPTRDDEVHPQLVAYLHERTLLLILDNCEHVLDAAPLIGALLRDAPGLTLLCTSRAALRIQGEHEYPVAPLPLPEADTPAAVAAAPAVQLLVQRAHAAHQPLVITAANAASIGAICRHLDGLPLALELAAARFRTLTPQDLLARLRRSLPLLTSGRRDAPDRQRTLRNTIAWSYELLSPAAQAHLRRLAVFDGGADLPAIAAVWGMSSADPALLDALTHLGEQSLLLFETAELPERYRLFVTVREFAAEQLAAHGEEPEARALHATYFRALAEAAEPELNGPNQQEWLARLGREQANCLRALDWLLDAAQGRTSEAVRFGVALAPFWWITKRLIEGRAVLDRLLAAVRQTDSLPTAQQAALLQWAGTMAWGQADYSAAEASYAAGLAICRTLNEPQATARALKGLGTLAREQGRAAEARRLFEEALSCMRAADDIGGVTLIASHLGMTLETLGDYGAAQAVQQECLDLSRALGDTWSVAYALKDLAYLALQQGDLATAQTQIGEALTLFEHLGDTQGLAYALLAAGDIALGSAAPHLAAEQYEQMYSLLNVIGDRRGMALAHCGLGDAALAQGAYAAAHAAYTAALGEQHVQRNPVTLPRGLAGAARLAAAVREPERAAQLFAAAQAVRDGMGIPVPAAQHAEQEVALAQVRRTLGAERFAGAWASGQALSVVEAIALAGRAMAQRAADPPLLEQRAPDASQLTALTAREREVLRLVALGMSNNAIAAALQMSAHTVNSHVRAIFSKLDVANRAAATRVALEQGLLLKDEG